MRYWNIGLAAGACAACCAPLIIPLVGTALVGTGAGALGIFGSVEAAMVVLVIGLIGVWLFWRRKSTKAKCACAPEAGCNTGASCDIPQSTT